MTNGAADDLHCSMCGKSQHEVVKLIAGPTMFICNECVMLCAEIVRAEAPRADDPLGRNMALSDLRSGLLEMLNEVSTLRVFQGLMQEENAALREALRYWAKQPLSTEPEFHRTRPLDLALLDAAIMKAREAVEDEE